MMEQLGADMNNQTNDHDEEVCAWETGALGASAEHVKVASPAHHAAVDEALGLQMISIRLPKDLIEDLKFIASREHLGYQPLIRRVLLRFAAHEFKNIATEQLMRPGTAVRVSAASDDVEVQPEPRRVHG
jgi:predicted DNA binding CopG/RHH family protein